MYIKKEKEKARRRERERGRGGGDTGVTAYSEGARLPLT